MAKARKRITGRTGFDRQTKTRIDRRRREGATFAQIADELGMSSSSFYAIRNNQRRMGKQLQKQSIEDGWGEMNTQEHRVPISEGYTYFDEDGNEVTVDAEYLTVNLDSLPTYDEYLEGEEFERPTITKTVTRIDDNGNPVKVEISYKFGRGKSDEQRERIENQLREQGIDPAEFDSFYDDATGYSA
jgi:hypothetical protein